MSTHRSLLISTLLACAFGAAHAQDVATPRPLRMNALPDAPPLVLVSPSPYAPEISARIGATAFLPKPCEPSDLVSVIGRITDDLRPLRNFEDEDPTGPVRHTG
jgi:hypothetical protein